MKVSFDFDGTLDRKSVQKYASELVEQGIEVWIVTSRYESIDMYEEDDLLAWQVNNLEEEHNELFEVADRLGIPREHIHFTNMEYKYSWLYNKGFIFHLDDNPSELRAINRWSGGVVGISVFGGNWKAKCQKVLRNYVY